MKSPTQSLTETLIERPSVTPNDAGCQDLLAKRLEPLHFEIHRIASGPDDARVSNLFARRLGSDQAAGKLLVFAGHTDVVPTGILEHWTSPPFIPTERDGKLFGRGASDMKSSLAAFVVAIERFLARHPNTPHHLGLLLTSDEEGPAVHGTRIICDWLQQNQINIDYCIVGEPTAVKYSGDTIKNGRRGSLSGNLRILGIQGHVAYPQLAQNPIHQLAPALAELAQTVWDPGNADFPPTTWQVSNIHSGTGATNVIPGELTAQFNFRFSPESTPKALQSRLEQILRQHGLKFECTWTLGAEPFQTPVGSLTQAAQNAIEAVTGKRPTLSTTGGTSDARFLAKICPQVIELGPPNDSIHQIDEYIQLEELERLTDIYEALLASILTS